ncbi:MAG: hypothetical protein QM756_35420 [Polyangiaceae bacterium]
MSRTQAMHSVARAWVVGLCLSACGGNSLDSLDRAGIDNGNQEHVLYRPKDEVFALRSDAERLYWKSGVLSTITGLRGCVAAACDETVVTYTDGKRNNDGTPLVKGFTVEAGTLYWVQTRNESLQSIVSCPVTGCTGEPTVVVAEVYGAESLLVRGNTVYWSSPKDSALLSCSLVGCTQPAVLALNQEFVGGFTDLAALVAGERNIYWSNGEQVMSAALDGRSPPSVFAANQKGLGSLAVNATHVFWQRGEAAKTIVSCPLDGCEGEPTVVVADELSTISLVADASRAYWIAADGFDSPRNASIRGASVAPVPAPVELYRGESETAFGPLALALGPADIYWVGWGTGDNLAAARHSAIYRMPK